MTLGEFIKKRREDRGLSQGELARLAGFTPAFISRLEKGAYTGEFTVQTLEKLARALKSSVSELRGIVTGHSDFKDKPTSLYGAFKEISSSIIEIPILAELHMPGEIVEYTYMAKSRPGKVNYVGVRAKGFCLEPQILDGDILIIDKDAVPEPGKTILCYQNGSKNPCIVKFNTADALKAHQKFSPVERLLD
jgi:transcriptional regulator with XRE-family HTH domain